MPGIVTRTGLGALALTVAAGLAACGDSDKDTKGGSSASTDNKLAISIAEQGKAAKYTVPKTAKGGLATVEFTNKGKQPHSAQLVLIKGKHTPQELGKAFDDGSKDKAEWARFVGGAGVTAPGQSGTATVKLEAGHYFVVDVTQEGGPPTFAELDVKQGEDGSLPSTDTTITAKETGEDKWRWDVSGPLKAGPQTVTFKSEGKEAVHFIGAFAVKGNVSEKTILKAVGKPKTPKFVDEQTFYTTAILDGDKSEVTQFVLKRPGRWVLFCPLTDRGEKEEHDKQGLVKVVDVK